MSETLHEQTVIDGIFEEVRAAREQVKTIGRRRHGDEGYVSEARNSLEYDEAIQSDTAASHQAARKINEAIEDIPSPFHRRFAATAIISGLRYSRPPIDTVKQDVAAALPVFDRIYQTFDKPARPVAVIKDATTIHILQSRGAEDLQLERFNNVGGMNNEGAIDNPSYGILALLDGLKTVSVAALDTKAFPEYGVSKFHAGTALGKFYHSILTRNYGNESLANALSYSDPESLNYRQQFVEFSDGTLSLPKSQTTDELNYAFRLACHNLGIEQPALPELSPAFKAKFADSFGKVFADVLLNAEPRDKVKTIHNTTHRTRSGSNTIAHTETMRRKSLAHYTKAELLNWFNLVDVSTSDAVEATKVELEKVASADTAAAIAGSMHAADKLKPFFARLLDIETA